MRNRHYFITIVGLFVLFIFLPPIWLYIYYHNYIHTHTTKDIAIVFGASVNPNFTPSDILKDRLDTAINLYENNEINKILVSGDNRTVMYNEPIAMATYLESNGIPETDIIIDYAGLRTYDTCKRAKDIFQINSATLVTQEYHMYRALFVCNHVGVSSDGVPATHHQYLNQFYLSVREFVAIYKSFIDIYIWQPPFIGGGIEKW
jgi:vancomycin permeability regulator SanA